MFKHAGRIRWLRDSRKLNKGQLLASATSTIPGIAANPFKARAVRVMTQFKQRNGPFVLLAKDMTTALQLARYIHPELRALSKASWPGPVTLVFPARPPRVTGLIPDCYQNGHLAIRVEQFDVTRVLAKQCGGLLLSSSLNRRGKATFAPSLKQRFRYHRWISGVVGSASALSENDAKASALLRWSRQRIVRLRG